MYLKSLTLRGFKSFASATSCELSPGINVVVGPNGSGKSNIVDALAWVFGEQGAKSLRGASMQDVIFAGSTQREQLGRAKVAVVLDNSAGTLDAAPGDIEIARTMFRSGGSEYTLNGQSVRRSDIQSLLEKAGISSLEPSTVGQGQIDRILHASPQERRTIVEEACGIHTFRRRAEKTERKLEAMKANLHRLEDLESELANQLAPLADQADTARSARQLQSEIRELNQQILRAQWQELADDSATIAEAEARVEHHIELAQEKLTAVHAKDTALRQESERVEQDQKTTQALISRVEKIIQQTALTRTIAAERLKTPLTSPSTEIENQRDSLVHAREKQQEKLDKLHHQQQQAQAELDTLHHKLQLKNAEQEKLRQEISQVNEGLERQRTERVQATERRAATRAYLNKTTQELHSCTQELKNAQQSAREIEQKIATAQQALTQLQHQVQEAETKCETIQKERRQALKRHEEHLAQQQRIQLDLEKYRATSAVLHDSIEQQSRAPQNLTTLSSVLKIHQGWEKAVGHALHLFADAVLAEKSQEPAHSTLFTDVKTKPSEQLQERAQHYEAHLLEDLIDAPQVLGALSLELANTLFVEHRETAQRIVAELDDVVVFDQDGNRWSAGAVIYAQEQAPNLIHLQAEDQRCQQLLQDREKDLKKSQRQQIEQEREIAELRNLEKKSAHELGRVRAEAEKSARAQELVVHSEKVAVADNQRLQQRIQKLEQEVSEAQETIEQLTQIIESSQEVDAIKEREQLNQSLTQVADEVRELQESKTRSQMEAQHLTQQVKERAQRIQELQTQNQQVEQQLEQARRQYQEQRNQRSKAELVARKAELLHQFLERENQQASASLQPLEEPLEGTANPREQIVQEREQIQRQLEQLRERQQTVQVQRATAQVQKAALEERMMEVLGVDAQALVATSNELSDDFELGVAQEKLEAQKQQLKDLGTYNPLALEEYDALEQRHSYLFQQIDDLKKSRTDMRLLLKDLQQRIHDAFVEIFAEIAEHFRNIFQTLFPDGEGELILTDPNDILNSGIDIKARPGGKKVKRLSLLSGGERTMASIAFLVALFEAHPAPFYILDEVEAALDDRNLDRVLEVFQNLRQKSQLIIITHKPRTVEVADAIFGISMRAGESVIVAQNPQQMKAQL